ncbi:MAG: NAD(+)/NADH kinase [Chloroflexi bacterium]|nr:NAD(+)/NADH kinase [Chloroflexota bacterium]
MERFAVPTRFAFCYHPDAQQTTKDLVDEIIQFLYHAGVKNIFNAPLYDAELIRKVEEGDFDVLVAVGGDGTMLRAGHLSAPVGLPILGINTGGFGFLTEVKDGEWHEAFENLFAGAYRIEKRMMLQVEHWRNDQLLGSWSALNEVVVTRGWDVRPIQLEATVDGFIVGNFIADGLIVSTATGSTAYALAAGGPIMPPDLPHILIIPVAPHLSVDRAIILSQGASVKVTASTRQQAVFSVDGQHPIEIAPQDHIQAYPGKNMVSFIRFKDPGYFYHNLMIYMERNPSIGKALS